MHAHTVWLLCQPTFCYFRAVRSFHFKYIFCFSVVRPMANKWGDSLRPDTSRTIIIRYCLATRTEKRDRNRKHTQPVLAATIIWAVPQYTGMRWRGLEWVNVCSCRCHCSLVASNRLETWVSRQPISNSYIATDYLFIFTRYYKYPGMHWYSCACAVR